MPITSISAVSAGTVAVPDRNRYAIDSCASIASSSARTTIRCRDVRSASTPPISRTPTEASVGAAMTIPASLVEPVSSSTPKAIAIGAIAVPV
jgi:hypothetical protein